MLAQAPVCMYADLTVGMLAQASVCFSDLRAGMLAQTPVCMYAGLTAGMLAQTAVSLAAFAPDGRHCLTAAPGERHVALWTIPPRNPASKKLKPIAATAVLSMEEGVRQLHIASLASSGSGLPGFDVCVVSAGREVHVWHCAEVVEAMEVTKLAVVRVGAG
jgi:hypothetical protein